MQHFEQREDEGRDQANAWIAQFAPLVMANEVLTEQDLRRRLTTIEHLRHSGPAVRQRLGLDDYDLSATLDSAMGQLDSLEEDLRRQLGRIAPGDPAGLPDLDALNERLDERRARQEIGVPTAVETPEVLTMNVSPGNWVGAGFLGIFGLGWNAFTLVHAIFMIGGMYASFGPIALAMLLFYGIFFAAGFGMLYGALNAASSEELELDGNMLRVVRKLGFWTRVKSYEIDPSFPAEIRRVENDMTPRQANTPPVPMVVLHTTEGHEVGLGRSASPAQKERIRDKINAYLRARA